MFHIHVWPTYSHTHVKVKLMKSKDEQNIPKVKQKRFIMYKASSMRVSVTS